MDVVYFLKERTNFIRFYYDQCVIPFATIKRQIEEELPPFDHPPYSEDGEPPYLNEWTNAEMGIQVAGLSCVSMLSDSAKLYFECLQDRVIGFGFSDGKSKKEAFNKGFVAAYTGVLGHILDTEWADCPADLKIIEQVVLARNRAQHGSDLLSLHVPHSQHTLDKHPQPFFVNEYEREVWMKDGGAAASSLLMPNVTVTREALFTAIEHVEKLADWIEGRMDKAAEWRLGRR